MKEWTFTPSIKDGIGGKVNGIDVNYGWYSRELNNTKQILCVTDIGIYITIFEHGIWKNTELQSTEIESL